MEETMSRESEARTAKEAGWHISRYNICAPDPETKDLFIVNLMKNTRGRYSPAQQYLLSILDELPEDHPAIPMFAGRGIIANYDELAALKMIGRSYTGLSYRVSLTICPTMNCNFDCPYCYEDHIPGYMSEETQKDVVALAEKMLSASHAPALNIAWFGGEPLLAPDIIESLSERLMAVAEEHHADYSASILTNGFLLDEKKVDLLERCRIHSVQITVDGLKETHDKTRRLSGGGGTFERIVENISRKGLPFPIKIRHNVYAGNKDEMRPLEAFVQKLSEETGNELCYYPTLVTDSETARKRGEQVRLLYDEDACRVDLRLYSATVNHTTGHYCRACNLWAVTIGTDGSLYKCEEKAGDPHQVFGNVRTWDPLRPLDTAEAPDRYIPYLNSAVPFQDEECLACVWLPLCAGGCPQTRISGNKRCVAFKNEPERYARTLCR